MNDYSKLSSLEQFVLKEKNKNIRELKEAAEKWVTVAAKNKLTYEIEWMGIPVIQTPEDLILMQELIFNLKPDIIVETGIAHGGSLIFYASILEILGKGEVIGIDIDIREHNRKVLETHPLFKRITMIEGDSLLGENIRLIEEKIPQNASVIVALDSKHTRDHVLQELKLYNRFVTKESYMVVFDTHTSDVAKRGAASDFFINNGPMEAVEIFLDENEDFVIDKTYNKLYTSFSRDGFLKRIK